MRYGHSAGWVPAIVACCMLALAPSAMGDEASAKAGGAGSAPHAGAAAQSTPNKEPATSLLSNLDLKRLWQDNCWFCWPFNWPALLLAILLGWAAGQIAAVVLRRVVGRLRTRDRPIRTLVFKHLIGPAKLALLAVGLTVGLAQLKMSEPLQRFGAKTLLLLYTIAVFWYLFNLVSVVEIMLRRISSRTESTLDEQLVPLIRKVLRGLVVAVAAIFVIESVFHRDIFALVAAIGVLGLPLGFAAKDVLCNFFGAVTILFNRPFRIGERIVYAGYDGVIEDIGFQSIRVRTLTGNLVTIPNSKIASEAVENIGRRPSIRRIMNLTITYDTPRQKIEQAVQILRDILEEDGIREPIHAVIDGSEFPPRVYFNDYNADSLNLFLIYWYVPPAYWDYADHAQRLNLRILEEFEKAGIEFAFPTRTVYVAGDPKREMALRMLGKDL
jgi:small-conductance mechanosensitive channel